MSDDGCPLCGSTEARKAMPRADLYRYDCPADELFEIIGSRDAKLRGNKEKAKQWRDWVSRQRKILPNVIPRIG
jgi:hypothetical protein